VETASVNASLDPGKKSPGLLMLTAVSWLAVSFLSWRAFYTTLPEDYGIVVLLLFHSLHLWWMAFWLWGIHNFWLQTLSFFPRKTPPRTGCNRNAAVAILYTACDDFDAVACSSCLSQTHPKTRVIICDDSRNPSSCWEIDQWAGNQKTRVHVVRRHDKSGFKAGNLNYAIRNRVHEEFILICDADEIIPTDFVSQILIYFSSDDIGFVQASHRARSDSGSWFSSFMGLSINLFWRHCMPLKNRYGFVACLGHGVMIRRNAWEAAGGFPEIVSEDIGFAARAARAGFHGVVAEDVIAEEAPPPNYRAFRAKYRKAIGGTVEFFQKEFWPLARSPHLSLVEKLDALVTFSFCFLGLVSIVNLGGGIILSYIYRLHGYATLQPWLLSLYLIGPFTPIVPLAAYFAKSPGKLARYMSLAAVAYVSLMPGLAAKALQQLLRLRPATFEVTGKVARLPEKRLANVPTLAWGIGLLGASFALRSPIFAPSICLSTMFMAGPLLSFTESHGLAGFLARNCGVLPYIVLVWLLAG
jgi:cellulose synthase/poly-beta-1,6-N-acetylglucosamine synthase-like glycosyltransferase